jgi:cytochrome b
VDAAQAAPLPGRAREPVRVPVWDLPTRVFHWSLVALVGLSWATAEAGRLDWHRDSGHAILALLVFRVYWGFAGSSTSRFLHFVPRPRAVLDYARRLPERSAAPTIGHNPVAALGVLALLGLLIAQVGLGLFAVDVDGVESGPLSYWVSFETGRTLARGHHLVFDFLLASIALHVAAVLFYLLYKRDNLIEAMVRGDRSVAREPAPPAARIAPLWRALPGVLLALALAWLVANGLRF